jgi:hypothetical protein
MSVGCEGGAGGHAAIAAGLADAIARPRAGWIAPNRQPSRQRDLQCRGQCPRSDSDL